MRVLKIVSKDAVSLSQLNALIAADQAFASEVLTIVNSPLYTLRTPVTGIMHGIARLGLDRLKGVAITVGVRGYLGSSLENPSLRPLWRHSLACAFLAELYAPEIPMDVGAAYTAGIMHDIGRLVLAAAQPAEYAKFLQNGEGGYGEALNREKEIFGVDHCELGRQLVTDWKLPHLFVDVTSRHHTAAEAVGDSGALAVVRFACKVASAIGFAAAPSFRFSYQKLLDELPERPDLVPARFEELALWISRKINSIESG